MEASQGPAEFDTKNLSSVLTFDFDAFYTWWQDYSSAPEAEDDDATEASSVWHPSYVVEHELDRLTSSWADINNLDEDTAISRFLSCSQDVSQASVADLDGDVLSSVNEHEFTLWWRRNRKGDRDRRYGAIYIPPEYFCGVDPLPEVWLRSLAPPAAPKRSTSSAGSEKPRESSAPAKRRGGERRRRGRRRRRKPGKARKGKGRLTAMAAKSVQAELDEPQRPESSESDGDAPTDGAQGPPADDDPFSAAEETEPPGPRRKGKARAGRKRSAKRRGNGIADLAARAAVSPSELMFWRVSVSVDGLPSPLEAEDEDEDEAETLLVAEMFGKRLLLKTAESDSSLGGSVAREGYVLLYGSVLEMQRLLAGDGGPTWCEHDGCTRVFSAELRLHTGAVLQVGLQHRDAEAAGGADAQRSAADAVRARRGRGCWGRRRRQR